jgi:hypothetical protein
VVRRERRRVERGVRRNMVDWLKMVRRKEERKFFL